MFAGAHKIRTPIRHMGHVTSIDYLHCGYIRYSVRSQSGGTVGRRLRTAVALSNPVSSQNHTKWSEKTLTRIWSHIFDSAEGMANWGLMLMLQSSSHQYERFKLMQSLSLYNELLLLYRTRKCSYMNTICLMQIG